MKKLRAQLIAFAIVTVWAVLSYAYLGVEDGSSGLSPLGWLHAAFFVPGGILLQKLKGTHSNADLPLMAVVGWVTFSLVAAGFVQFVRVIRKQEKAQPGR